MYDDDDDLTAAAGDRTEKLETQAPRLNSRSLEKWNVPSRGRCESNHLNIPDSPKVRREKIIDTQ